MINELLGVIATCFIIIGFMQTGEFRIRLLDMIGATLFIIYGILIHSFSTVLLNSLLVAIQIYKLYKLWRSSDECIS